MPTSPSPPDTIHAAAYAELRRLARRERRQAQSPTTLDTTALVHEAWFKFARGEAGRELKFDEFRTIAARAMRQVLVDHARRTQADKRRHITVTLGHAERESAPPVAMLELDEAMQRLEAVDARLARIVDLHVFSGLEFAEIARVENLSERSAYRLWRSARVFLLDALTS